MWCWTVTGLIPRGRNRENSLHDKLILECPKIRYYCYDTIWTSDQNSYSIAQGEIINDTDMKLKGSLTERFPLQIFTLLGGGTGASSSYLIWAKIRRFAPYTCLLWRYTGADQFLIRAVSSSSSLLMEPAKLYVEFADRKDAQTERLSDARLIPETQRKLSGSSQPIMEQISMMLTLATADSNGLDYAWYR